MSGQNIHEYIQQQRAANVSDEAIKQAMVGAGWNESDVASALHPDMHYPDIYNSKLLGPVELLKRAWKIFQTRIWTIIGIQIMPLLVMLGLSLIILIGVILASLLGEESHTILIILGAIVGIVAFGFLIYISLWSQVAVIIAIRDSNEKIGAKESYNRAKGKLGVFFGASLLAGLAVFGGYLLFIIPGIIFAIWFMFAGFIAIDEGKGGSAALGQSREYTRNLWWEIASRVMFITLVSLVLSTMGQLFSLLGEVVGVIMAVLISIGTFLIGPVFFIYPFELYRNVKTLRVNSIQIQTDTGKLFALVAGEIVLFILLYSATFFLELKPKLQEQLEKVRQETRQSSDINSIETNPFFPVGAVAQARDAARTADLSAISTGLRLYYVETLRLPNTLDELAPTYIAEIPVDPQSSEPYSYAPSPNGAFEVCAEFETKTPARKCVSDKNGQVQGISTVRTSSPAFVKFMPKSSGFKLFLRLIENFTNNSG